MSKFSKLIIKIMGIEEDKSYDSNFDRLVGEGWKVGDSWHLLKLYCKGNERVIYNPYDDSIIRHFIVQKYQNGKNQINHQR